MTDSRIRKLGTLGYDYALVATGSGTGAGAGTVLSRSPRWPRAPLAVPVAVPAGLDKHEYWQLLIAPTGGWAPAWRDAMLAVVVVGAGLISALSGVVLRNRRQLLRLVARLRVRRAEAGGGVVRKRACWEPHTWQLPFTLPHAPRPGPAPLPSQLPPPSPLTGGPSHCQATNHELADEKERMDVLLARQMDLIACAVGGARASDAGGAAGGRQSAREAARGAPHGGQGGDACGRRRAPASCGSSQSLRA